MRIYLWILILFFRSRRYKLLRRILENTSVDYHTGCWVWLGSDSGGGNGAGRGYGRVSVNGAMMATHRVVWTHFFGIIPHKKHIDHTCNSRLCCNPKHLELVTHKENCKRRDKRNA